MPDQPHLLVLGGQRSGKSRFAERVLMASGRRPVYIATAAARDAEMAARIALHRDRREPAWLTVEEPLALAERIRDYAAPSNAVLVDCLTLWLSNLMEAERPIDTETGSLLSALADATGPVVLVSNEVGSGIIPDNALGRRFADSLGILNQRIAAAVPRVVVMTAGLPLVLKPAPSPEVAI
ncbi:MAG: bifunctional adenosylcobinamide kinase/adenosylcobinamide-phosphate guanylyltransferase [Bauldia sp.]